MQTTPPGAIGVGAIGVGVIVPYDFALDRELWRWVPDEATLHLTRTPHSPLPVSVEQAVLVGDLEVVGRSTRDLSTVSPDVVAYACTSGSFIRGLAGEQELAEAILAAGAPRAVTTSGALVRALQHLGATRVAVATPYDASITRGLVDFLAENGVTTTATRHLGLEGRIWTVPPETTVDLVRRGFSTDCEAVFISCTNLATYDIIGPLEAELGVPVLTANQVTLWAALRAVGSQAVGPGQALLHPSSHAAPATPGGRP